MIKGKLSALLGFACGLGVAGLCFTWLAEQNKKSYRLWQGTPDESTIKRILEGELIGAALLLHASTNDFELPKVLSELQPGTIGTNIDLRAWKLTLPGERIRPTLDSAAIASEVVSDGNRHWINIYANGNARLHSD
jgi:hypothetical protein